MLFSTAPTSPQGQHLLECAGWLEDPVGGAAQIVVDGCAEVLALNRTGDPLLDGLGYGAFTGRRQDPGHRLIDDRLDDLLGTFRERLGKTIGVQVLPQASQPEVRNLLQDLVGLLVHAFRDQIP